jgi:hypothetical protein
MTDAAGRRGGIVGWLARLDDGVIIRTAFFAMLAGTLGVLYIDYRELTASDAANGFAEPFVPVLPSFDPLSPMAPSGPEVTTDFEVLKQPLTISLGTAGTLNLVGAIDPGAAQRFADEIATRGEYVKVVSLNSPGGSVNDALAIGQLIRDKGLATEVAAGAICASSCPLVFAGGSERRATSKSAIGVHQVYATQQPGGLLPTALQAAGNAMSDAQKTTATVTRHLVAMGVDAALWIHALETPPERLYYLSPGELTGYRLVTVMDGKVANTAAAPAPKQ